MARPYSVLVALALALTTACGSDSSTGPQPAPEGGDITIVKGASLLTSTAFSPTDWAKEGVAKGSEPDTWRLVSIISSSIAASSA